MIALDRLNGVSADEFVETLSGIFEHSPWVAAGAAPLRPFASRLDLLEAMRGVVRAAPASQQLALILAHPPLGAGRTALPLTKASTQEQRRAGLDACTAAELARLVDLNAAYRVRFGFPFILAVRGHDPRSIIDTFEQRQANAAPVERETALQQIGLIAGYRLADAVASPPAAEILAMLERIERADASGTAAVLALLREWMLAAGFEPSAGGLGADALPAASPPGASSVQLPTLCGIRRGTPPAAACLLLGAHHDPATEALRSEGHHGALIAIAVLQSLKQTGTSLPFDVLLAARPLDPGVGMLSLLTEADAIRGCVAVRAGGGGGGGGEQRVLAIVRQASIGRADRAEPGLRAAAAERASQVLEEFIRGSADGSHARTFVWS